LLFKKKKIGEEESSVLHLTQLGMGGHHITSLIEGAFEGWRETLNFFKIVNSLIEEEVNWEVLLPDRETIEVIWAMTETLDIQ
jgi:hypothetical protein